MLSCQTIPTPCAPCRSGPSAPGRGLWRGCFASSASGWRCGCCSCRWWAAAGTPSAPSASSFGTPSSPPTGAALPAPTASFSRPTAAAGPSGPPPGRCRKTALPLRPRAFPTFWRWTKRSCWKSSATAAPTTVFSATGWTVRPPTPSGTSARPTASPASASSRIPSAGIRRENFSRRCWASPTWTMQASRASS